LAEEYGMNVDVSSFHRLNVSDTCAVWNVLSSLTLYRHTLLADVHFVCPPFVVYECLFKPREATSRSSSELRARLERARGEGKFQVCALSVGDLQTVQVLEQRRRLGKGELSAIALAQKIGQALLTDDQKARRLAQGELGSRMVQTTPHLLGWLLFEMRMTDGDVECVIAEHTDMERPLERYFREAHQEACRCRLLARQGGRNGR
jgi:predicted nucleic acid-binding protein